MPINFSVIKGAALVTIESVLNRWAPGGKRGGNEYVVINSTRSDGKPGSFKINLKSGKWKDFATGDAGLDVVSYVAYIDGVKQTEAAERLAAFLGLNLDKTDPSKPAPSARNGAANTQAPTIENKPAWRALLPVPTDAPPPPKTHPKHGKPSMRWLYRDASGGLVCLVYRFEPKAGGERKQFYPLTFCEDACGKRAWRRQGVPEPRPLYRLDTIAAAPDAVVIVCEGEKAADAAAVLFPDCVTTTMLNGAQSPHKTDWQPLAGRVVWLWPDNDEAGRACMLSVADLLAKIGVASVQLLNIAIFERAPSNDVDGKPTLIDAAPLPEKWDAADTLAQGWTVDHIGLLRLLPDWLQAVELTTKQPSQRAMPAAKKAADDTPEPPQSRFHCNDQGVWFFVKNDTTGNDARALPICSKLEITAMTRDAKNESWGRLLEFTDADGSRHTWALPIKLLIGDGNEYQRVLADMGLRIETMPKARNLLTQYIQTAEVTARARCVERTGWHGRVFVMPEHTIGESEERILFQSASAAPGTFKQRGKLADWQAHVAAPAWETPACCLPCRRPSPRLC